MTSGIAATRADPDPGDGHGGLRPPRPRSRREQRRSRRRAQLHRGGAGRSGVRRGAAQQLGDRRRRHREDAVGGRDRPGPDGDLAHDHRAAEVHEPRRDADDVGDRVEGADLVEVHVVRVRAVHGALGLGQPSEGGERQVADRGVEGCALQQQADVAPGAVVGRVGDLDVAAGRGEAAAGDLLDPQRHLLRRDRVDRRLQHLERHPGAEQRPEQHVAARARRGVDPDRHRLLCRATRAAKTPAP
ncbi:unannotated protein [freshwater metagenome]|uniref:Unannotated protein n=1 Tax=freshwater metagenome TaxID=449393 RepID=A0A6J6SH53_9ZZZZ